MNIYFKSVPFSKNDVTLALESGVDGVIVPADKVDSVSALSRIPAGEGFSFSQSLFSPQFRLIPEAHTGTPPAHRPTGQECVFFNHKTY